MSIGFNWFKKYKIIHRAAPSFYDWYELNYLYGNSTCHSAGNVVKVQNLIEKYSGKRIPSINEECIVSVDYELDLIEPNEMVEICDKILSSTEVDKVCMRDRIEQFKKLSEEGYYLTYDID